MPIAALLPFLSTLAGGIAALRLRHRLHPFMAVASGVLVATAIANLLPEAHALVGEDGVFEVAIAALAGYLALTLVEAFIHQASFEHESHDEAAPDGPGAPSGPSRWVVEESASAWTASRSASTSTIASLISRQAIVGHPSSVRARLLALTPAI